MTTRGFLRNLIARSGHTPPAETPDSEFAGRFWFDAEAAPVELAAAAEGGEGKSLPTFDGTAYTGGTMRPMGFYRDVVVDLSACKVAPGKRPVHRDHSTAKIVGHAESGKIVVGKRQIKIAGIISGTGPDAVEVSANGDNGFPWQLSIGARIQRMEWVEEGESVKVNGRVFKGGIYVVRACTIYEVSFVSLGGDDATSARVAASTEDGFSMNFTAWLTARGHDINTLTAQQLADLRAAFEKETGGNPTSDPAAPPTQPAAGVHAGTGVPSTPLVPTGGQPLAAGAHSPPQTPATPPPPTPEQLAAQAAEADRVANERDAARLELAAARQDICARFGNPSIKVGDGDSATEVPLLVHATREGWTANETELHARRNSRPEGVTTYSPTRDLNARGLEAALCMTAGCDTEDLAGDYNEQELNCATDVAYRGANLKQLFASRAAAAGHSLSAGRFDDDTIRAALEAERDLRAHSSTFSVSGILSNVANKRMQAVYKAIPDVLMEICDWGPVNDFKEVKHYQLTVDGDWAEVGADGELKHGTLKTSDYTNAAKTRGLMIALTREHIRNDDLRAFLRIPAGIARKSANKKQKVGFGVLLQMITDNVFSLANGNLLTGASSVLGIEGLQLAVNLFKQLKDEGNEPIGVRPAKLLTGTAISVTADNLYKETNIDVRLDGSGKKVVLRNNHAGKYEPHDTTFLDSEYGGNDTGFFLCADKADVPILDGVALDGRQVPYVQRGEANFNTLGMQWRGFDDWGIAPGNPHGAVYSAGQ